jgi:hypothetical protein
MQRGKGIMTNTKSKKMIEVTLRFFTHDMEKSKLQE